MAPVLRIHYASLSVWSECNIYAVVPLHSRSNLVLLFHTVRDRVSDVQRRMKFKIIGETLSVAGVRELGADNSQAFREQVCAALPDRLRNIEIDLSQTSFLDSCGLGALISLRKTANSRNGTVRLLNPPPRVQLMFDVTRMHKVFEIVIGEEA